VTPLVLPYGSWPTPITSELVVRSARLPSDVQVDRATGAIWWSESRPEERGRNAVLRLAADGEQVEVLPAPWNARTGVHEYGGGAWWVHDDVLWFADWATQRLHRLGPGDADPVPLTPEPARPGALRYADGALAPDGATLVCVQEEHRADGEVRNTIVRMAAHGPSTPEVLVAGPDFVSDPRWRADGGACCWLEWDHPDMPWDATRLVVLELATGQRTVVAGGERRESVVHPTWAADGALWCCTDRTGHWSIHRWTPDLGLELVVDRHEDIGLPQWVFGQTAYALLPDGAVAYVRHEGGFERLSYRSASGDLVADVDLDVPYSSLEHLRAAGHSLVAVVASSTTEPHVARLGLGGAVDVLVPPRDLGLDPAWFAPPEAIDFPTAGDQVAHALYYPPTNPECVGPADERPPLLVFIHGGPTSAARPMVQLSRQYWTSRGFAVVDVNYRGSTGYGRAYRDLLQGQWGVADVEDCVAVVRQLAAEGRIDGGRACIRGGSAGGFTTLAALAFHDVFAAGASHYGVADLAVLAEETHKFEARYLDGLVGPWPEARATYDARSPIHHLDGITAPLAVFQGLEDPIVPPNQAEMIVTGLRSRGVAVAYVTFEGEGHGFRQAPNIRASMDGELSFYAQVLGFALPEAEGIPTIELA
jgi:dipeptidyl aminopeptidase/acylaminoacyl peptidase